ncbi:MAG: hypothetical protein QG650_365 [Patescibacteria group bacterium]|nr:hypothetical protein [Patescibacteria group bacterium]
MNEPSSSETPITKDPSANSKKSFMAIAVLLLAVSAGLSGYLKYQVWSFSDKTAAIRQELAEFETKIGILKADPAVAAADLLNRNKASLEQDISRSEAQRYVTALTKLHLDYDVDFDGFSFSNGKVSTIVSARQTSAGVDPIDKMIRFIGDYRSGSGSAATSPFVLSEVRLVSGDNTSRTFNVEFKIK